MFLKQVVLEGFKSYRDRTDIGPFDRHFNAITGLNGSGKSNILDAICFVMGLSSMHVVRAANLGELIYKGGAGGVNKASASLVFDNRDKEQGKCPVGYEKHDEIIVSRTIETSGQCKYYLNSVTSTKKAITDMFESVQLSVSNPNFMIMQGKITKVINMNPKQILSMIEETVGGNVYQGKRNKTEQEIVNKDRCVKLVETTINQEIFPEWKRQRTAREKLHEFQTTEYKTQRALKNYAIKKYEHSAEKFQESKAELEELLKKVENGETNIARFKREIEANKERQRQMKQENVDKFKGRIDESEKALNSEKKSLNAVQARLDSAKEDVKDAEKKLAEFEKDKKLYEKEKVDFMKKSAKSVEEFENVKAQITKAEDELKKAREQENALKMGNIVDDEGNMRDARQELMRVQTEVHNIQPDYQVAQQQYDEDMRKLENMQKELKKTPTNAQVERNYNEKIQLVEKLKAEAVKRNINPDDTPSEILKTVNGQKHRLQQLIHEKDQICGQNFNLSFRYERKNEVDPSKIHGCLYELLKFNNLEEWGGGMEVLAGGLVGQVVVEDEQTGKALLRAGLCRRMTIHPLSVFKTSNRSNVTQQELDRKLGPGKAVPAISLVEYDSRHREIVQHFFGGRVLCDTMDTARKVAYQLGHWAVSKLGDVADPDGVMQGGSRKDLGRLIRICDKLRQISVEIKELNISVVDLQKRLQVAKSNEDFMKQLETAKRDLHNAEETRKMTSYSILERDILELKEKLEQESGKLKETKKQLEKLEKEKKSWEAKVSQLDHLREKDRKDILTKLAKWEKELQNAKKKYEAKQKQFDEVNLDLNSREELIQGCQRDINTAMAEIEEEKKKLERIKQECDKSKERYDQVESKYNAAVAESLEWNTEFNAIEEENHKLSNEIHKIDLSKIKLQSNTEKLEATVEHYEREIEKLKEEHKTVRFGQDEVEDEDKSKSLSELKARAEKLKKKYDELSERIDIQAAEQYDGTKALMDESKARLTTLEDNKRSLMETMSKLDHQKLDMVQQAYGKVNAEFDKMMGTLLPESKARLVPVNVEDLTQGLNIHVCLGEVWKESLAELSGGQKSLVALALVLSLCMYNPAPMYILDEIDAALDLNHTQNIGALIKKRFKDTQFICVSLKDGMYSNCNLLFQVQYNNGRSEVKRCVRGSKKTAADEDIEGKSYAKHLKKVHGGR